MLYLFIHIPKTGGQTLIQSYYKAFGRENIIKVWNPRFGADVNAEEFTTLEENFLESYQAVAGHIKFEQFLSNDYCRELLDSGAVSVFSCLRDPIERLVSLYNYICASENHPLHSKTKNAEIGDFLMSIPSNTQFNHLCKNSKEDLTSLVERINLTTIKRSRVGVARYLNKVTDNDIPIPEVRNVTSDLVKSENEMLKTSILPKSLLDKLNVKHAIDFELYSSVSSGVRI